MCKLLQISNMEHPWGKCNSSDQLRYSPNSTYSYEECTQECLIQHIMKTCNCTPYYISNLGESRTATLLCEMSLACVFFGGQLTPNL